MITKSEQFSELFKALSAAHQSIGGAVRGSANPFLKNRYAALEDILIAVKPALAENNLSFLQDIDYADGHVIVTGLLTHDSGQWLETSLRFPLNKTDPQELGKLSTYCRRYQAAALFSVPQVDTDAKASMLRGQDPQEAPQQAPSGTIDKGQAKILAELITTSESDLEAFLKLFKVASLAEFPEARYRQATDMLRKKLDQAQGGKK